jgi:hypothetical protein
LETRGLQAIKAECGSRTLIALCTGALKQWSERVARVESSCDRLFFQPQ